MPNPRKISRPTNKDLWDARDLFRELLDQKTTEQQWQQFFSDYPFVFSMSLPLRLEPEDIVPFGRPGRTEPDFVFFPHAERPPSFYGVIELKRPDSRIITVTRSNVAILSRDAATAIEQARSYARNARTVQAIQTDESPLFLGNNMYLFVIMGMSAHLAIKLADQLYRDSIARQLPDNLQLMPFDRLLHLFEAQVPPQIQVLVPATEGRTIQAVTSFEYYHDASKEHGAPASGMVHVSWDEAAGEWSEWERGEFLEGYEQGAVVYLPYEKEKASIGLVSAEKLLEMHGLSPETITIDRVRTMNPQALRDLAEGKGTP